MATHAKMDALFDGCMQGRTLYVIPYCMGPIDSPLSRCGVEITDSPYVVANMRIMTRMGARRSRASSAKARSCGPALDRRTRPGPTLHHAFPRGVGDQVLRLRLRRQRAAGQEMPCAAHRVAPGAQEGWLAEHMLILGLENPQGETHYIAAAFPSACGKTNLAMLIPPEAYREAGWKVWTVGDDICWMRPAPMAACTRSIPEAGFFGVAPGTSRRPTRTRWPRSSRTPSSPMSPSTADNQPWWEGIDNDQVPATDWQGESTIRRTAGRASQFALHRQCRQCPSYSSMAEDPQGVPISAIVFGGRRASLVPLVFEARDWTHGVLVGASMGSETTAAATGAVGVMRRDPMAMKPFCGYNFADYFAHWLSFDKPGAKLPKVFHVNWFRKGDDGKFLWPGFGDNLRVLEWMIGRVEGTAGAIETPIGRSARLGPDVHMYFCHFCPYGGLHNGF
jgi:phosphoenolpyruvate carboxykinase (GTP)